MSSTDDAGQYADDIAPMPYGDLPLTDAARATARVFEGWVILELMGHRRLAGHLSETQIAGAGFLRLDVPARNGSGPMASQFYAPSAVYCITPTSESTARAVASLAQPAPVSRWELPAADPDEEIL